MYFLLSLTLFFSTWTSPFTHWVGLPGDVNEFMWGLAWLPYAFAHNYNFFLSNYLMYPKGINLMWNTTIIGPAFLLAPITLALGVILSYNLLATLAVAISAFVGYLAIKRFTPNTWACFSGGLLFGFSPYMVAQSLGHMQLTCNWYPPTVLIFLDLFLIRKDKRKYLGVLFGILTTFQLLTGEEVLLTTVIFAVILLLIIAILFPSKIISTAKDSWANLAIAILTSGLLSAYPLYIQFFGPNQLKGPIQGPHGSNVYVTDLANLVTPTPMNYFFPHWAATISSSFTGNLSEWNSYIGIPILITFVVISITLWKKPVVRVACIFSVIVVILSMGTHLHVGGQIEKIPLPWSLIKNFPILQNVLPSRLINYAFLSIAVLLSIGMEELARKKKVGNILAFSVSALCLIPLFPNFPYPSTKAVIPKFFVSSAVKIIPRNSVVLISPYAFSYLPSLWQIESKFRFKMPEGPIIVPSREGMIEGAKPSTLRNYLNIIEMGQNRIPPINGSAMAKMRADVKNSSTQTVIIGPSVTGIGKVPSTNSNIFSHPSLDPVIQEQQTKELFTLILRRKPKFIGGVYIWTKV